MINISKDSWHYRFMNKWDVDIPYNLCPYVRKLVGLMFLSCAMVFFGSLLTMALLSPILQFIPIEFFQTIKFSELAFAFGIIDIICLSGLLIIIRYNRHLDRLAEDPDYLLNHQEKINNRKPNVFWEWLKARHDDLCPGLNFEIKDENL